MSVKYRFRGRQFSNRHMFMGAIVGRALEHGMIVTRMSVVMAAGRMQARTPVLTGHAYSSWSVAYSGRHPVENKAVIGLGPIITSGLSGPVRRQLSIKNLAAYSSVLEEGGENREPHGMARLTMMEFPQIVRQMSGVYRHGTQ